MNVRIAWKFPRLLSYILVTSKVSATEIFLLLLPSFFAKLIAARWFLSAELLMLLCSVNYN